MKTPTNSPQTPWLSHADYGALFAFTCLMYTACFLGMVFILSSIWSPPLTKSLVLLESHSPQAISAYLSTHPAVQSFHFHKHAKGLVSDHDLSDLSDFSARYELPELPHAFTLYAHNTKLETLRSDLHQTFALHLHHLPTSINADKMELSFPLVAFSAWFFILSLYLQYLLTNHLLQKRAHTLILAILYGASTKRLATTLARSILACSGFLTATTLVITQGIFFYGHAASLLPFFTLSLWIAAVSFFALTQLSYCLYLTYYFFHDTINKACYH